MKDKEYTEKRSRDITKQEITIPFLWEDRPGATKENWKTPKREPLMPVPQPVKYVASVPFKWEEKPGTPLRCFSQEYKEHSAQETVFENKILPLPPAYFTKYRNESNGEGYYDDDDDGDYQDWLSELDFEALDGLSEESSSSASSLLQANRSTPNRTASSAVPPKNTFLVQQNDGYLEGSSSSESINSPVPASKNESMSGASFLQHLFPLNPPRSRFLDKPNNTEENNCHFKYSNERRLPTLEEYKKINAEFRRTSMIRRQPTLGELIMQSRRRNYHRKAVQMKKNNPQKDCNEKKPQGCFNLRASGGGLTKLLGKDLLTLRLS